MSYATMLWSGIAAAALVLAAIHITVWILDRRARPNLAFAIASCGLAGVAWCELGMMSATSPAEWGSWVRWAHFPNFFMLTGTLVFIRLYLRAGRLWLMWAVIGARAVILVVDFLVKPNFNFRRIDSVVQIPWLGQSVSVVGEAVTAPWQWFSTVAAILSIVYIVDAAISAWRLGTADSRRKALVVGGGFTLFFVPNVVNTQLMVWGLWRTPTLVAPSFLITLTAMAFEMSRDTLRASRLARELRESERALQLAASAGGLGLWWWSAQTNSLWATDRGRAMFDLAPNEPIVLRTLAEKIAPEDIPRIHDCLRGAKRSSTEHEISFRVVGVDGSTRWVLARGRCEFEPSGGLALIRGVVRDVTEQHSNLHELEELRANVTHSSRVTALGHLASALAHELRQPLVAIQSNVEAAQLVLQGSQPLDVQELREILSEVRRDELRAAEVIDHMRAMMKRQPVEQRPMPIEGALQDVIALVRSDALRRGVTLETRIEGSGLTVRGDRVHLSQVLVNLILNAMDAMNGTPPTRRRVSIAARRTDEGWIEVSVADQGTGIAEDKMPNIFEPFFTTKAAGMGIGLSVCRTIVESHDGRLWAENNAGGGATFRLALPALAA